MRPLFVLLLCPALLLAAEIHSYTTGPATPLTPGFHKLVCEFTDATIQPTRLPFTLYLPSGYGTPGKRFPMVTFLGGLGDRGDDPGIAMCVGVPLEIGRDPDLRAWMPMIVLTPQCPSDRVWETPGMPQRVLELIDTISKQFQVDASRLYLTGFSNGGLGCWALATEAPDRFALIAPIVSREFHAQATAQKLASSPTTFLIISGTKDPKSEPASANMAAALREKNADVVYAPVENGVHFIWSAFYRERAFYEFLLQHQLGRKPATRPTGQQVASLYASRQQATTDELVIEHRLQRGLDRLEPYWFVDNCAHLRTLGLQQDLLGRPNVFVTQPLAAEVPCRLQTTRPLPAGKKLSLQLEVGHPAGGEWELVVRINENQRLRTLVNDTTAPGGWLSLNIDLADLPENEARFQLIQHSTTNPNSLAYWAKLKITP